MIRLSTQLLLTLLATIPPALAQTPPPATPPPVTTLKVQTKIVAVSAVVYDKSGAPVSGLTLNDFLLKEDGKPQTIRYFSEAGGSTAGSKSTLPLTLALMVDTSGSQRAYIRDEIAAGKTFFSSMMTEPEDRALLVQFDTNILQLASITSSVPKLEHALAYLTQPHDDIRNLGKGNGGTLLYDAICAVSHIQFSNQLGRRAMVILTDGDDHGSQFSEKKAIEEAQRAGTAIYSVYYSNGGGAYDVLKELSAKTGGRVFTVDADMTLPRIYAEIADELRQEYEIGYRPPNSRPNKFHKIQLTAKDKTLTVQSREGYFTPK